MPSTVRVPDDIYQNLREIKVSLESERYEAAPTVQDLISVALKRFLDDWNEPEKHDQLLEELLEHRKAARSRMGKRKSDRTEEN